MRMLLKQLIPPDMRRWLRSCARNHTYKVLSSKGTSDAFALFGDRNSQPHFERVYLGGGNITARSGLCLGDWSGLARKLVKQHGLVVIAGTQPPPSLRPNLLRVPRFVALSADVGESEDALYHSLHESARYDVRKARQGFQIEVHRDVSWVEEFCQRYHERAITLRHGAEGFLQSVQDMQRLILEHNNEFVCVTHNGERLAAVLAQPESGCYRMGRLGWRDADPDLLRRRVLGALYWFTFVRARELGLSQVKMGGTPPYLEDGVFRFKTRWNATLDRKDTQFGEYSLLLDPAHPKATAFLALHSLLAFDEENGFLVYTGSPDIGGQLPERVRSAIATWISPSALTGQKT
jgi:hypothetical protein